MNLLRYFFFFPLIFTLLFSSCKKDELLTDSSAKLDFSTDSILYDTVFSTLGSTTKSFRIYNRHNKTMNISRIFLAGGTTSAFKLNVDGISGKSITDMEILGGDSLFVFVQVTVNPLSSNSPILIKDSIVFETNGNIQDVKLTAIGQDVYLHIPNHFPTTGFPPYSITGREGFDTTLPYDKPHVFFGWTVIDSDCKLTMKPGTKCYFYNHAVLLVYEDATLIVDGDFGNEVIFQGYRQEAEYREIPGQWGKIWFWQGSKNNEIDWAIIKNGGIGIQVDSVATPGAPTLKLSNTIIKNMTAAALFGQGARIWSNNCLFANCGQYCAALSLGGIYNFEHCTFANFWSGSETRTSPLLYMNNYYISGSTAFLRPLDSCNFKNCIIYGYLGEEVGIDSTNLAPAGYFSYKFDHCLIKTARALDAFHYDNCFANLDPGFRNVGVADYRPATSTSNLVDKGNTIFSVFSDLKNLARPGPNPPTSIPDAGAYEFH